MSVVDPSMVAVSITCLLTMTVIYVLNQIDRILERRERNGKAKVEGT